MSSQLLLLLAAALLLLPKQRLRCRHRAAFCALILYSLLNGPVNIYFPIFVITCIAFLLLFSSSLCFPVLAVPGFPLECLPPTERCETHGSPQVPRVPFPWFLAGRPLWVVCAALHLAGSTPTHRLSAVRLWAVLRFALLCLARSGLEVGRPSVV